MRPYHCFFLLLALAAAGCSLQDPVECTGNVSKCTNDSGVGLLFTCLEDHWSEPVACEGNALCAEDGLTCQPPNCTPSDVRCTNTQTGGVIEKCNEQHQWETSSTCEDNMGCLDDVSCQTPERCTPGNTRCTDTETGGILSACDESGHWKTQTPCKNSQKCSDAFTCETNACTPGETTCVNMDFSDAQIGNLLKCNENSEWDTTVACPGNAICKDDISCAEPSETTPKCTHTEDICQNIGDTAIGQIIHCEDGEYSFSACPNNSSCRDELNCGECTDGSKICKDGYIYQCSQGVLEKQDACESGECFDETRCLKCTTKCVDYGSLGNLHYECEGREPVVTPCDDVSCNPDTNDCGECMNPTKGPGTSCINNEAGIGFLSGCRGGKRFKDEPCINDASCYNSAVCGSCRNGTAICTSENDKSYMMLCNQGSTNADEKISCPKGSTCNDDGNACEGHDSVCGYYGNGSIGRVFYSNGTYRDCSDVSCNEDMTDCGECSINTSGPSQSCKNNEDGVGIINGCVNGKLYKDVPCKDNVSCNSQGNISCGTCHTGDWKCEEDASGTGIISICVGGLWNSGMGVQSFPCPAGKGCTASGCADSTKTMCVNSNANRGFIAFKQKNGYVRYACKHECNSNNTDCVCETGEVRCEENDKGIGILSECMISSGNSYWGDSPSAQPQKYSCNTTGCSNDNTFCDTDKKEFCVDRTTNPVGYLASVMNNTVTISACPSSYSCAPNNICGDCNIAMPTLCNDGVLSKCIEGVMTKTPCDSGVCKNSNNCE